MIHARLTIVGAALATLVVSGCAGPAWFAERELPLLVGRRSSDRNRELSSDEVASTGRPRISDPALESEEPSLSKILSDVEYLRQTKPSGIAEMRQALDESLGAFPPQYQQLVHDQFVGEALKRQQAAHSYAEATYAEAPYAEAPYAEAPYAEAPYASTAQQTHPLAIPTEQLPPRIAQSNAVAPASFPRDLALPPLRPGREAAQTGPVSTNISDEQPDEAESAPESSPATVPSRDVETVAVAAKEEEKIEPGQWNREIEEALASLAADLKRPNLDRNEKARLEVLRRLMYVATNQREAAVSPIEQLDEDEREYWKHQIHGLLVSIDADGKHPTTRRAALALRDLRTASDHLANVSTLDVKNVTFCTEVLSYGEYRVFDSYTFRAQDEVVLYVEIDNFAVHPRGDSFETELHASYEIVDDAGRRVANVVLPVDKQVSNNRRRDYFIPHLMKMPAQIDSGAYRLRLTVEDVIGKKSNHATIDFRIK